MPPTFSVVIPTYQRRDQVSQAVASCLQQTLPPHEVIVVVDGGTDDSPHHLRTQFDDPRLRVIEQPNLGRSLARNTGIAASTGDWVCFLDDDDLWHREKLQVTAGYLADHPDCQALNAPVWFFTDRDDGPAGGFGFVRDFVAADLRACHAAVAHGDTSVNDWSYLRIRGQSHRLLLERNRGVMSTTCIRRDVCIRCGGFPVQQISGEEWSLFVNVARLTEWHTLPRRLGFVRLHASAGQGGVRLGVVLMLAMAGMWRSGRPMPRQTRPEETTAALQTYRQVYRDLAQTSFWDALAHHRWGDAMDVRAAASLVLPRWRDRLWMLLPKPLTWRLERYLLGRHRPAIATPSAVPPTALGSEPA